MSGGGGGGGQNVGGYGPLPAASVGSAAATAFAIPGAQWIGLGLVAASFLIRKTVEGPRARTSVGGFSRSDGDPFRFAAGRRVRVPGSVYWLGRDKEIKNEQGGKGPGAGAQYVKYTYEQSFGVEWCKAFGRPAWRFLEVWANGEKVWALFPDVDETSTLIGARVSTSTIFVGNSGSGNILYRHEVTYYTSNLGPDLTLIKKNKPLQVNGFTDTALNSGSGPDDGFEVLSRKKKANGDTEVTVLIEEGFTATHPAADESPGASVTIFQSLPTHSQSDFASVTHHLGTLTQTPDQTIVDELASSGEAMSGMRDRVHSVFKNWRKENYGNVIPQDLYAVIEMHPRYQVADAIEALCGMAGIGSFDASDYATDPLEGFVFEGPASTRAVIDQLEIAYDMVINDDGNKINFKKRANLVPRALRTRDVLDMEANDGTVLRTEAKHLVAHSPGETPPRAVAHAPTPLRRMPASVSVRYVDSEKDYQPATATYVIQAANGARSSESRRVDIGMRSSDAQVVCRRLAWTQRANAHGIGSIQLPPSQVGILPGTLLAFEASGRDWVVIIDSEVEGLNGVTMLRGREEQQQTLVHTAPEDPPPAS